MVLLCKDSQHWYAADVDGYAGHCLHFFFCQEINEEGNGSCPELIGIHFMVEIRSARLKEATFCQRWLELGH